jgi:putative membrane protein insertion efficiency factor
MSQPMDARAAPMSLGAKVLLALVSFYRYVVSPALHWAMGPRCRFQPSCSCYAADALRMHGARHGGWLALRRVLRCHPFHPGGFDPVPLPEHGPRAARAEHGPEAARAEHGPEAARAAQGIELPETSARP